MTYILVDNKNIISVGKHSYYGTIVSNWPYEANGDKTHKSKVKWENGMVKKKSSTEIDMSKKEI